LSKSLVIVESPAKAKTISKFLGRGYAVEASAGHIRDLPPKALGVNIKEGFAPRYEIIEDKEQVVKKLKKAAIGVDHILLAPDPDREGEAIAWHLAWILKDTGATIQRIEFNEITQEAIQRAILVPRNIDAHRVDAQQARRILDRLVGYKLSPLLWQNVRKGLSAGRVQSVAVRLICTRESAIKEFEPQEYWTVTAHLQQQPAGIAFTAELVKYEAKKPDITHADQAAAIKLALVDQPFQVDDINTRKQLRQPPLPFITSTLQREAANRFNFTVKQTMRLAQQLYEGIELPGGATGLITYMRTDSTRIAQQAQDEAAEHIKAKFGEPYLGQPGKRAAKKPGKEKAGAKIQDAHEAIRPSHVEHTPEVVRPHITDDQYRLYKLIWGRFLASQMSPAQIAIRTVEIKSGPGLWRASDSKILFPGFLAIYEEAKESEVEEEKQQKLPDLTAKEILKLLNIDPKQHFTQPPPRFTEATLVKALEEQGIGRPSTYAPTIATIMDREYVKKEGRALMPTELGMLVNDLLVKHFPNIVDPSFTAQMEDHLDKIESGKLSWQGVLEGFYGPFAQTLQLATVEMQKAQVAEADATCEKCGKPMALRSSRYGPFLGCTGYPKCKNLRSVEREGAAPPEDRPSEELCQTCNGPMVIRTGRYGDYLACTNESCKARRPLVKKTGTACPQCGGQIVEKRSKKTGKVFYGCDKYPTCNFILWGRPTGTNCGHCSSPMIENVYKKGAVIRCSNKACGGMEAGKDGAEQPPKAAAKATKKARRPKDEPPAGAAKTAS